MYDAVIVGGGPAGLSAAIYLARAKCKVLVIEKEKIGGQITITADVVNYPGTGRVSGSELAAQMEQQARGFGAEFVSAEVIGLKLDQDVKELETTAGTGQALGGIPYTREAVAQRVDSHKLYENFYLLGRSELIESIIE